MTKQKIFAVIEGLIIAALGVLIAIYGPVPVLDTYVAIVCLVLGVAILIANIVTYADSKVLAFGPTCMAVVLVAVGATLLTDWLSLAVLVNFLIIILMGLGFALMIYGAYLISKKLLFTGVGEIVIGALLVVFSFLYIFVPDFRNAFWIIVGVLIAIYGVFYIVAALVEKKKK